MKTVVTLAKGLVNLIYPLHCASCGKYLDSANTDGACGFCLSQIKRNPRPYCSRCGRSIQGPDNPCSECRKMHPSFDSAYSACLYEGTLKTMIHRFKYDNARMLSGVFSAVMIDFVKDNPEIAAGAELITFIPLHKHRAYSRGFNQSELLASRIGKELGIPVKGCMEKMRSTKNQNELSREERLVNVEGTFRVISAAGENVVGDSEILIIDDVMTTGATLNEASRVLMAAGARRVRCLTLARGA